MPKRARRTLAMLTVALFLAAGALGSPPAAAAGGEPDGTSGPSSLEEAMGTLRDHVRDLALAQAQETAARAAAAAAPACAELDGAEIPQLVADVFRCRLREAGFADADVDRITAEAVVVSHCESLWNPAAVVFDGRYLHARHPATGMFYSAAGVFQFIRKTADLWIVGGYGNVHHPTANIDAAARLYLDNVSRGFGGWDDWACAAANDGFQATSVLPGWPGGPPTLPDWAHRY